jgi:hypothetical protein
MSLHLPIIKRQNILTPYFDHVHDFSRNIVGNLGEGVLGYTGDSYVICLYWLILTMFKYTFKLQGLHKVKFDAMIMIMKRVYLQHTLGKIGIYGRLQSQLLEIRQKFELADFQRQIWSVTAITACPNRFSNVKEWYFLILPSWLIPTYVNYLVFSQKCSWI